MEKEFAGMVLTKVVHLDEILDEVQRVGVVWFRIFLIQGLKVGNLLKMAQVTIITCELNLNSILI